MPNYDDTPDPLDKAYLEAEALLNHKDERAARRARVLSAVATPETTAPRHSFMPVRGGWLAAATVAGISILFATELYRPNQKAQPSEGQLPSTPSSGARPPQAPASGTSAPETVARGAVPQPTRLRLTTPVQPQPPLPPIPTAPNAPPPDIAPPPPLPIPPVEKPIQAPPPPAPAPPPAPLSALRAASPATATSLGERLRTAAAAGWLSEVQALLDQGVPPDAPDAEGETALMQSIRAGHPTVVTLLVSHGASLDWTNSSGETARSLAAAKADRSINRALGLER